MGGDSCHLDWARPSTGRQVSLSRKASIASQARWARLADERASVVAAGSTSFSTQDAAQASRAATRTSTRVIAAFIAGSPSNATSRTSQGARLGGIGGAIEVAELFLELPGAPKSVAVA